MGLGLGLWCLFAFVHSLVTLTVRHTDASEVVFSLAPCETPATGPKNVYTCTVAF